MLAPICLFTYNRPEETRQTVEALQKNNLAPESCLYVFSDGPKNEIAHPKVADVRKYIRNIKGFKSVDIIQSPVNKGLANSIIEGVTQIINQYGKIIVLEDDLVTSPNFLDYMNFCLNTYNDEKQVFSVSGFSFKVTPPIDYMADVYFYGRAHSWGWGTWKDRWEKVDWKMKDYNAFKNDKHTKQSFNQLGSDMNHMLESEIKGKINSWYIRFAYHQFKQNGLTIFPVSSKVLNIGFNINATHTNSYNRIKIDFDKSVKRDFLVPAQITVNLGIAKQRYYYKSLSYRMTGKLLTQLMRLGLIKQRITQ